MKKPAISCLTKCLMSICATTKQYQKLGMCITTNPYHIRSQNMITSRSNLEHMLISILLLYRDTETICKITHSSSFADIQRVQSISFRIMVKCLQSKNSLLCVHYLLKHRYHEIFQFHLNIFHLASEPFTNQDELIL